MSYQVLARKWRPRFFREMVGQEHVLQALINALDHNRLHHAYLFTGTRGVGKTTIARILAKCLNCEVGVSSEPCGQCSSCMGIAEGRFIDLIEVDAASNTGVDDVREIIENAQYRPSIGRYKVYIIDEVHMLSKNAFNALLKTLEEPPEHAKFLLAITDPQKLPPTVLSRCLQFHLKNMIPERIAAHLKYVLQQEMVDFEEAALWALARAAQGSMRDGLSLTDQSIAFGKGKVLERDVRNMLGTIDQQTVYRIAEALILHDAAKLLATIAEASEQSPDFAGILDELLLFLHRMTVAQMVPSAVDNSLGDREQILALAKQVTAEELQLFYQMGVMGKRDFSLAPDPRCGLEMAVLRMLAFCPEGVSVTEGPPLAITLPPVVEEPVPKKPEPVVAREEVRQQQVYSGNEEWVAGFAKLPFSGLLREVAAGCVLLGVKDDEWQFGINRGEMHLYNPRHDQQIAAVLSGYFSLPVRVTIQDAPPGMVTPAQFITQKRQEAKESALHALQADTGFRNLVEEYSATLDHESVEQLIRGESA